MIEDNEKHIKECRDKFRTIVFKRDNYTCKICKQKRADFLRFLFPHRIMTDFILPKYGYVKENGISLCPKCHDNATSCVDIGGKQIQGFSPDELYQQIQSSYDLALKSSD